jgi:Icc-related predicted phosphoesterase
MGFLPAFLLPPSSLFEPPSFIYTLLHNPLTIFFTYLHNVLLALRGSPYRPPPHATPIKVICISDTHSKTPPTKIPIGDLLIHAGDLTDNGTIVEIQQQVDWLKALLRTSTSDPSFGFQHIVVVCGNHDSYFDPRSRSQHDKKARQSLDWGNIHYLEHSSVSLTFSENRTLKIYGAPQIPKCGGKEFAFQYVRGQDAWSNTIPDDVDVLVTHNPPKWHLDIPENGGLGCEWLLKEIWRVKPTLHIFGHVHAGHGRENVWWDKTQQIFEQLRERGFGTDRSYHFLEVLDSRLWIVGVHLIYEDIKGLLWTKVWGGTTRGGFKINAALTYRSTGRLGNAPQVAMI